MSTVFEYVNYTILAYNFYHPAIQPLLHVITIYNQAYNAIPSPRYAGSCQRSIKNYQFAQCHPAI